MANIFEKPIEYIRVDANVPGERIFNRPGINKNNPNNVVSTPLTVIFNL